MRFVAAISQSFPTCLKLNATLPDFFLQWGGGGGGIFITRINIRLDTFTFCFRNDKNVELKGKRAAMILSKPTAACK